jgi:hypothetical protein
MRDHQHGKLKLGKGSYFVKSQLRRLPRENDIWEADIFAVDQGFWIGIVINQADEYLAQTIRQPPTVNELARLLAEAMQHGVVQSACRPRVIHIRERPEWVELLPHLKQIGIQVEYRDKLPKWDQLVADLYPELKIGRKGKS